MSRVHFDVVIPARYASSRLPGKALADIAGKPMIAHVAERARASGATQVWIATDHEGIRDAAEQYGFKALMTRSDHATGTDRVAEVVAMQRLDPDSIVVNVQGDEPLIEPGLIRAVASLLRESPEAAIATACHPIHAAAELFDPNVVKLVLDHEGYARYFSRAPMPWARDAFARTLPNCRRGCPATGTSASTPTGRGSLLLSRGWLRLRSNNSRRSSSCARSGTGSRLRSPCATTRRTREWIHRKIWNACAPGLTGQSVRGKLLD